MKKYFIDDNGRVVSECVVDVPANPAQLSIVESETAQDIPQQYVYLEGQFRRALPRIVPQIVTRYQGRAALLQMGLLDDIDAHYAALPIDTADEALNLKNRLAKERWAGMLNFERDSEELVELASAFGMSATQVDDLFCFAETIK